jgi:hypothetical protein
MDRGTPMLPPLSRRRQDQEGARAWKLSSSSIGKEEVGPRRARHYWAGIRSVETTSSLAFMGKKQDNQQSRAEGLMGVGPGDGR